jgi:ABC-type uncharacterized transport system permease subunit
MVAELIFFMTALAYAAASAIFFAHLATRPPSERVARSGPYVLALAVGFHATYICVASLLERVCPVESVHFVASVAALFASALYLALRRRAKIDALGAFVAPVALTFVLGSRFVGMPDVPEHRAGGGFIALHVTVNILGDALFLLASAAAVLYLIQEKRLKQKRAAGLFGRLPPLDALDRAEHRFLLTGFPLLTLGILTGTVWAQRLETGTPAELARAAFAYATWILFAGVLLLRALAGWRGKRAAYGTIAGFVFAVAVLVVYLVRGAVGGAS